MEQKSENESSIQSLQTDLELNNKEDVNKSNMVEKEIDDKQLMEEVLSETLELFPCPICGKKFQAVSFFSLI